MASLLSARSAHPHVCLPALKGRDAEAASGFLDEIKLLNCLTGRSNIIQLIDSEVGGRLTVP